MAIYLKREKVEYMECMNCKNNKGIECYFSANFVSCGAREIQKYYHLDCANFDFKVVYIQIEKPEEKQ